jgi:hypothetical protein
MQAGGVEYLTAQALANPGPFLGLLGKVMPREQHLELSGELKVRAEVRRDLVEKLIVLLATPAAQSIERETPAAPLPAIAHKPDAMLRAQAITDRGELSRRAENARKESLGAVAGAVHRAATMHAERSQGAQ